jgi:4-amino-4-deoxy-L-arabinose transferase-like glycosyltransferase
LEKQREFAGGGLLVILVAAAIFGGCAVSPPSLMDDVDAVQAQIARNMLESGDWATARLNGIAYLEKAPLKYWMIAGSFALFGIHDWAARIPIVLSAIVLCWVTARFGAWAFGGRAGTYAGLGLATCCGLFLFTRILIPDVILTLAVTLAMWRFLRVLEEAPGWKWPLVFWSAMGAGFLLKGLIAMVFPVGGAVVYLLVTRRLLDPEVYRRLRVVAGPLVTLAIAAPWVVLASIRNPPVLDFTMRSVPGEYHGFFWFFFFNEHLFRFLNMRHPRDYNTVPRLYFWLFHLLWLFPWSVYLPAALRQGFRAIDRAGRARLLCLGWNGFLLVFFTFSTTQEYYSMPCYPALALLIGSALACGNGWVKVGTKVAGSIALIACVVLVALYWQVRGMAAPGDISRALTLNPEMYTLSLGHMSDLTLQAFAYLRTPMLLAAAAFAIGAAGALFLRPQQALLALAAMMVVFTHAARSAMVVFDPYLSSRQLAEAIRQAPPAALSSEPDVTVQSGRWALPLPPRRQRQPGLLIFDNQYYTFSSVFFYAGVRQGLLLNGRVNNLEYGSYAPGAPDVFLDDAEFAEVWRSPRLCYLLVEGPSVVRIERLVGREALHRVRESGGKFLFVNRGNSVE